jgi:hypothetical protein
MSLIVVKLEYCDLFVGLKNMLLCLSYSSSATVRSKIMKIIKQLIKIDSVEMLKDKEVIQILKLRITDVSSMTRESALDILYKNLEYIESSVLQEFMNMVIDRAHCDTSLTVRKKVI